MATYGHEGGHAFNEDQRAAMREVEDGGGHDGLAPSADERRAERQRVIRETQAMGERARAARPFVAAFPVPKAEGQRGEMMQWPEPGMSLSEYYAGRALEFFLERECWPIEQGAADQIAKRSFAIGDAMEAEALRRRGGA